MDSRIKIFISIAVVLIVSGVLFGVFSSNKKTQSGIPVLKMPEKRYDFGKISMADGNVNHDFVITNEGDADLVLSSIKTSCMCTSAVLKDGEKTSPKFGMHNNPMSWSKTVAPGQSVTLVATFDPNFHGPNATGQINRTISFLSNDGGKNNQENKFAFFADVVK